MHTGQIIQINRSNGGVPKLPVEQATITTFGIEGDHHLYRLHGGPEKALLLMSAELIDTLAGEGFSVYYGALGENLTVRGLPHQMWRSGQKYRIANVLIQLTEPREACRKLRPYGAGIEKRMGKLPGESGYYASVLEGGNIARGATIQMVDRVVTHARF